MAELRFDASEHNFRGKISERYTPSAYAAALWANYEATPDEVDINLALDLAPRDPEIYEALLAWARSEDFDAFSLELQAALGRTFVRKPPRRGVSGTARRNRQMRAIADALVRHYGMHLTRGAATGSALCAAAVLAGLPPFQSLTERRIANILTSSR